jgi:hypothetical protein
VLWQIIDLEIRITMLMSRRANAARNQMANGDFSPSRQQKNALNRFIVE